MDYITPLITPLNLIKIATLTELFCNCPLLKAIRLKKVYWFGAINPF